MIHDNISCTQYTVLFLEYFIIVLAQGMIAKYHKLVA